MTVMNGPLYDKCKKNFALVDKDYPQIDMD